MSVDRLDVAEHFDPYIKQRDNGHLSATVDRNYVHNHLFEQHRWFDRSDSAASELLAVHRELHGLEKRQSDDR